MGYPNKLVPMTDVHGQPQQGGYLPAEIWHAYMAAVTEGEACAQFPSPTEPLSYQPFFGKFASTGQSSAKEGLEGEESTKTNKPSTPGEKHTPASEKPSSGGNVEHGQGTPAPRAREPAEPAPTPTEKAPAPPVGGTGGAEPPKH
jgi:membrane peptidoglycan carboxypeptidase